MKVTRRGGLNWGTKTEDGGWETTSFLFVYINGSLSRYTFNFFSPTPPPLSLSLLFLFLQLFAFLSHFFRGYCPNFGTDYIVKRGATDYHWKSLNFVQVSRVTSIINIILYHFHWNWRLKERRSTEMKNEAMSDKKNGPNSFSSEFHPVLVVSSSAAFCCSIASAGYFLNPWNEHRGRQMNG